MVTEDGIPILAIRRFTPLFPSATGNLGISKPSICAMEQASPTPSIPQPADAPTESRASSSTDICAT